MIEINTPAQFQAFMVNQHLVRCKCSHTWLSTKFPDFLLTKLKKILIDEQQNIGFYMASTIPHNDQHAKFINFTDSFWMMKNNCNCYFKDIFYKRCNKYQKTAITYLSWLQTSLLDFAWDIMHTWHFDWIFRDFFVTWQNSKIYWLFPVS